MEAYVNRTVSSTILIHLAQSKGLTRSSGSKHSSIQLSVNI